MHRRYWKSQNRSVQTFGFVYHDTNAQNYDPVWRIQLSLLNAICTIILWQDEHEKDNLRKCYWNTVGRSFPIGNVSSYSVKKDYSYLCMWTIWKWLGKTKYQSNMKDTDERRWLGGPTSFLDHVYLGCTQRECHINKDIVDNYRSIFESRISAGTTEKLPKTKALGKLLSWVGRRSRRTLDFGQFGQFDRPWRANTIPRKDPPQREKKELNLRRGRETKKSKILGPTFDSGPHLVNPLSDYPVWKRNRLTSSLGERYTECWSGGAAVHMKEEVCLETFFWLLNEKKSSWRSPFFFSHHGREGNTQGRVKRSSSWGTRLLFPLLDEKKPNLSAFCCQWWSRNPGTLKWLIIGATNLIMWYDVSEDERHRKNDAWKSRQHDTKTYWIKILAM